MCLLNNRKQFKIGYSHIFSKLFMLFLNYSALQLFNYMVCKEQEMSDFRILFLNGIVHI